MTSKQVDLTKNFFALGLMFWLYERSHGADARAGSTRSSASGRSSPRPTRAPSRPATTSARRPRCSTRTYRVPKAQAAARARTATSPATRRRRSASWPRRSWPSATLFYGSYPITPASDILHELSGYKNFGVKTFQAEDEIAAIGATIGAAYGGALGLTGTTGPGLALKTRGHGPGGDDRAAARHHRRPARRPVHRPADQDRAGRPAPGHVRPQRRVADAGRRPGHARPTASTMAIEASRIALKYMTPVIFLSDAFLGQRRRAVAHPDARRPARHLASPTPTEPDGVPPLRPRPGDARPAVGRARHARPRAPHRRPREGGRHRATSATTRTTTTG